MDLNAIREKSVRFGVGITAGGSAAGIEAAVVRIKGTGPGLYIKPLDQKLYPYPKGLRTRLLMARKTPKELALLNFELGDLMAEAALGMIASASHAMEEVDLIGCQGYSVAHIPRRGGENGYGGLSLGEPSLIAEKTGLPVVFDFRSRDLVAGGQGSLIYPYVDWLVFARDERTVARLHLGHVSTITVITPALENMMAFEAGPGNAIIDGTISFLTSGNQDMDVKGAAASKGVVIDEFLDYLLDHPYFQRVPPKSVASDDFAWDSYLRDALSGRRDRSLEDLMATTTAAVAYSIVRAYNRFVKPHHEISRVIVSGGGALNKTLIEHVRKGIIGPKFRISDEYGLPHDALDAHETAILANETLCGNPSNAPQATGADKAVIQGKIVLP